MKKHFLTIAAATALATSAVAQTSVVPSAAPAAQKSLLPSSITFYGIADIALVSTDNSGGSRKSSLESSVLQPSRFGFRGVTDLGRGLTGLLVLEGGFNLDNDSSTPTAGIFSRQSYIGLSSKSWGTVTAGRQYSPIYDQLVMHSGAPAFGFQAGAVDGIFVPTPPGPANAVNRFDNTVSGTRFNNAIKYASPSMSGLNVNAMVALGEVAGSTTSGQTLSAGAGYRNGPVSVGVGYLTTNCPAVTGCTATVADNKVIAVGGTYDLRVARISAIYTSQKNAKNVAGNDADVTGLIAQVPLGDWTLAAGYQVLKDMTRLDQSLNQFNLGAQYKISTDTTAYALYSSQKVDNNGKASMGVQTSSDDQQNIVGVGIRYIF